MTDTFKEQLKSVISEYESARSQSKHGLETLSPTQITDLQMRCITAIERAAGRRSKRQIGVAKALLSDIAISSPELQPICKWLQQFCWQRFTYTLKQSMKISEGKKTQTNQYTKLSKEHIAKSVLRRRCSPILRRADLTGNNHLSIDNMSILGVLFMATQSNE